MPLSVPDVHDPKRRRLATIKISVNNLRAKALGYCCIFAAIRESGQIRQGTERNPRVL
jgi:hypothetical protein